MSTRKLPSYRHHKPSGQAVVTLSGKDVYLGPFGTKLSRDNYDREVSEWLAAGRTRVDPTAAVVTVAKLVHAFFLAEKLPVTHAHGYKAAARLLVPLYGKTVADDFGPLALKVVRGKMEAAGWKRSTINARVNMLRRVWKWGVGQELVSAATLAALEAVEGLRIGKTAAPESEPVQPIDVAHAEQVIETMPPMLKAMVRLQLLTGMRAKELCMIRTCDIDTKAAVWIYKPASHKTAHKGKIREIAIGPAAIKILSPWLLPDLHAHVFSPARAEADRQLRRHAARKTPLSCGNRPGSRPPGRPRPLGDRYSTPAYRQAIEHAIGKAFPPPEELKREPGETSTAWKARLGAEKWQALLAWNAAHRWTPHQLRHTFAQRVRNEFGLEHAQKALGHANAKVTEIYAQVARERAVEVAAAIG